MEDNILKQLIAEQKILFWGDIDPEDATNVEIDISLFNLTKKDFLKIMEELYKEINQIEK